MKFESWSDLIHMLAVKSKILGPLKPFLYGPKVQQFCSNKKYNIYNITLDFIRKSKGRIQSILTILSIFLITIKFANLEQKLWSNS